MNYRLTTGVIVSALTIGVSYPVMADTTTDAQSQNTQSVQTTSMTTDNDVQSGVAQDTQSETIATDDAQSQLLCPTSAQNTDSIAPYVNEYNQKVANGWNYNKGTNQWSGSTYTPTEEEINQPITATDPRFLAYQSNGSNNWTVVKDYLTVDSSHNVDQTWYKATPDDSANYQVNVYDHYGNFLYTHKYNNLNNQIADDSNPTTVDKQNSFERFMEQPDVNQHLAYTQSYLGNGWYQYDGYKSNNDQYMSYLIKSYQYNQQYNLLKLYYSTENLRKYETTQSDQPNNNLTMVSNNSASSESQLTRVDDSDTLISPITMSTPTVSLSNVKVDTDLAVKTTNTAIDHTKSDSNNRADRLPQTGNDYDDNDVVVIGMFLLALVLIIIFGL